jgi:hypothetical protein
MRLWGRISHAPDHIVAAERDFFLRKILGVMVADDSKPKTLKPTSVG